MKSVNRVIGMIVFLSLYIGAIVAFHAPTINETHYTENSFQKKEVHLSVLSNETVYSTVEVLTETSQNGYSAGLKKQVQDYFNLERTIFSQEKSKFKQYLKSWNNLLIASKNTDKLYPHHTFG